ncbi:MAG: hypothetical protein ACYCSR_11825 [Thiomonas sp.]
MPRFDPFAPSGGCVGVLTELVQRRLRATLNKSLVRIARLQEPKRRIKFGLLKGKLTVPTDFDAPLPDDVLAGFEGR